MSEATPLYDDDGEIYALATGTSDGNIAIWTPEADFVGVFDADGEELDASAYVVEDSGDGDGDDQLADFDARLAALENYAEQPVADYGYEPEYEAEVDMDAVAANIGAEMSREAARRGADFTRQEQLAILARARDEVDAGRMPDIRDVLGRMADEGEPALDLDKASDRREWMTQRLQDAEAEEEGVGLGEAMPPSQDEYDLTRRDHRAALAADKLEGRDVDQAYIHDGDDFVGGYTGAYTIDPGDQ